jgi:hypothetical protein
MPSSSARPPSRFPMLRRLVVRRSIVPRPRSNAGSRWRKRPAWMGRGRVRSHSTRALATSLWTVGRTASRVTSCLPLRRRARHCSRRAGANRCVAVAAGRRSRSSPRRPRARTLRSRASALFRHRRGPGRGATRHTPCNVVRSRSSADRSDGIERSASGALDEVMTPPTRWLQWPGRSAARSGAQERGSVAPELPQ